MPVRETMSEGARGGCRSRRGNTIVLVVGLLVLLMIIATSFITRTHAGRATAVSQQRASLRDDNSSAIAAALADEIAMALFPRPIEFDPNLVFDDLIDSRRPRLHPHWNPVRYGIDQDVTGTGGVPDGVPDYLFNLAPFNVVPFTNWPDKTGAGGPGGDMLWPAGPGNQGGGTGSPWLDNEGNPAGNPGMGDSRWLADIEPVRWDTNGDGVADAFSHWRHMTNIARPENGWRAIADISNVMGDSPFVANLRVDDLRIPIEQWLAVEPANGDTFTGDSIYDPINFWSNWSSWFGFGALDALLSYRSVYTDPAVIPRNYYNLSNLDGGFDSDADGNPVDIGERPQDEFVRDTPRWHVNRVLADSDGDGFTDSFWFLAPTPELEGIRQLVAIRIIDNSAMLNVNVATRFAAADQTFGSPVWTKTRGETPADLALTGQLVPFQNSPPPNWNVGFYDNYDNWFTTFQGLDGSIYYSRYDDGQAGNAISVFPVDLWTRHLQEVGLFPFVSTTPTDVDYLTPITDLRRDYWRRAGLFPRGADPTSPYTPFGLPEEIELRMFSGNNYPWVYSRLEYTTQADPTYGTGLLRGDVARVETNEYGRLVNRDMVLDSRHHLTTYSGARNDLLPPWLWPSAFVSDLNRDGVIDDLTPDDIDARQFRVDRQKLDLRQPLFEARDTNGDGLGNDVFINDVDGDGFLESFEGPDDPTIDDLDLSGGAPTVVDYLARIRDYLDRALIDRDPVTKAARNSYFGVGNTNDERRSNAERAEKMAAAMAANIGAYRDTDDDILLAEAVPLRKYEAAANETQTDLDVRYLGLEAQPFLVEAVIVHVHRGVDIEHLHPGLPDPILGPRHVMCYTGAGDSNQSTIVGVQIANPFDRPIDLADSTGSNFRLTVFGQPLDLTGQLQSDSEITYLSMRQVGDIQGNPIDVTEWKDVLDLATLTPGTDLIDVPETVWSQDRAVYDGANEDAAVQLWRRVDPINDVWIVVDRIDVRPGGVEPPSDPGWANCEYRKFGKVVSELDTSSIDPILVNNMNCLEPDPGFIWPEVFLIGLNGTHWAQWVRASRPRAFNAAGDPPDERNPRYVFGRAAVNAKGKLGVPFSNPASLHDAFGGSDGTGKLAHFASSDKHLCEGNFAPDIVNVELDFSMQMLQKDADFEQVGELLNIWLFGHEIKLDSAGAYMETTSTFSEWMWEEMFAAGRGYANVPFEGRSVNRLHVKPTQNGNVVEPGTILGGITPMTPAIPAAARVLDSFVCDGPGVEPVIDLNGDGQVNEEDAELRRLKNANGFSGKLTPGTVNLGTAAPQVMRSLPHMTTLVHETGVDESLVPLPDPLPTVRVAEAIAAYRDRLDLGPGRPDYTRRSMVGDDLIGDGLRSERGLASTGELLLMNAQPATGFGGQEWRIDFAGGLQPFGAVTSSQISTDVNDIPPNPPAEPNRRPDAVAGDSEEANLLFSGMSNLVSTRSDVFTVYFKVRSFRRNPISGAWDATDPEYIVDDSRYVMLVDRSEVDTPADKPKIVYLEKMPK